MNTTKRYWSAATSVSFFQMAAPENAKAWHEFDARLTKDDLTEMQKIDADCNDCRHFARGVIVKVPGLTLFEGRCLKFDRPTRAYPMQHTGRECFEHRRTTP